MFNNKVLYKLSIYLKLMRFNQPIGIFLLLWSTLIALFISSSGIPSINLILIFILGTIVARSVGCIINDLADIDFDKHVERTKLRPLTNNQVTKKEAIYLIIFLTFIAFLCLIELHNWNAFKLGIISLLFIVLYPFSKRFFYIPQIILGITFSFGILIAYIVNLNYLPFDAWILFIANIFWIMAYDTIYAISDKEDDKKIGIFSSAITFGRYDILLVVISYIIFNILLFLLGFIINYGIFFYISIFLVICLEIFIINKIKDRNKIKCFKSFLNNNYIGLILFIGILLNNFNNNIK